MKTRHVIVLTAVLAISTTGSWVAARHAQTPGQAAAKSKPPIASWVTAPVERRVMSQTIIARGTLRPDAMIEVGAPSSVTGSPVITKLGLRPGDQVLEGQVLVEVSARPIFVLVGEVPAFRSMSAGTQGVDVQQLQLALRRLGCAINTDGLFEARTSECVKNMFERAGYSVEPEFEGDVSVAFGEVIFVPRNTVRVLSSPTTVGPLGAASTASADESASFSSSVARLAVGRLSVRVELNPELQSVLSTGLPVELFDETSGASYAGVLKSIADVPTTGLEGQAVLVGVMSASPRSRLPFNAIDRNLRVTITTASTAAPVLAVPLSAIASDATGKAFVAVVAPGALVTDHPRSARVTPGLSADGYVAITAIPPDRIEEGDRVVVGR